VLAGIDYARMNGGLTVGISCVKNSALAEAAQIAITLLVGPEVLTGSTRLKAGTATKMVLNMISTGVMVRTGATYGNLMVNVRASNDKLVARAQRIVAQATGCDFATATSLLKKAENDVKVAIVMHKLNVPRKKAAEKLHAAKGVLREVLG
jgi:N-acetylmuramic acid 6-phosphate etherase